MSSGKGCCATRDRTPELIPNDVCVTVADRMFEMADLCSPTVQDVNWSGLHSECIRS